MISKMIGGGEEQKISIVYKKKQMSVSARMGLYGTWLGVVLDGPCTGYIIVPRWQDVSKLVSSSRDIPRIKWTRDKITYPVVPSLYYALRQAFHILYHYGSSLQEGERYLVLESLKAARELNYAALGLRKGNVEKYERAFRAIVDKIEAQIGTRFYNPYRLEAFQYFQKLRNPRDKLGRPSETVKMVQAKAAERRLQMRIEDIGYIIPVTREWKKALEIIKDMIELRLQEAKAFLTDLLNEDRYKKSTQDVVCRARIVSRLLTLAQEMHRIDIQPYTFTCLMCVKELPKARDLLLDGKVEDARLILDISLRSLQLKDIQRQIEDYLMQVVKLPCGFELDSDPFMIASSVDELCIKLNKISEAGFKIKTKDKVISWLGSACAFLRVVGYGEAAQCLRNASDTMQVMSTKQ